jgi:hypothetical protein
VAGDCVGECHPGERRCQGLTIQSCDRNGMWVAGQTCQAVCTDGVCTGVCTPGQTQCGPDQTPQTCTAAGQWVPASRCPFVCSGTGQCTGVCAPGSARCNATDAEVCDGTGAWVAAAGDCVRPTVVGTSPADGARGVRADARLVVTFSEPMNPTTTQAAFSSPDIPAPSFSWDATGAILTVTPGASLEYARGGPAVMPRLYSFSISAAATDRAGNLLDRGVTVTFATLRRLDVAVIADGLESGSVSGDGSVGIDQGFVFTNCNSAKYGPETRAFLSFSLATLPAAAEIESAELALRQVVVEAGQTFPMAPIEVAQVHFSALSAMTFTTLPAPELGALVKGGDAWTLATPALHDALVTEYQNRAQNGNRARYRIRIGAASCDDKASFDLRVNIMATAARLSVTTLLE